MNSQINGIISSVENQYINWSRSTEKTKEFDCQIENIDIKIIFNRGRFIYPVANCPTPGRIKNTINIASSNIEKIEKIFNQFLIKNDEGYCFSNTNYDSFQMRFFTNKTQIKNKLLEEEKGYAPFEAPRWGLMHECIII